MKMVFQAIGKTQSGGVRAGLMTELSYQAMPLLLKSDPTAATAMTEAMERIIFFRKLRNFYK